MSDNLPEAPQGEFILFRSEDGQTRVECRFESYTLWLSQASICENIRNIQLKAIRRRFSYSVLCQEPTDKEYLGV